MKYIKRQVESKNASYMETHDVFIKIDNPNRIEFRVDVSQRRFAVSCDRIGDIAYPKTPGGCDAVLRMLVSDSDDIINFNDDSIQKQIGLADKQWVSAYKNYMDVPEDIREGISLSGYQSLQKPQKSDQPAKPKAQPKDTAPKAASKEDVKKPARSTKKQAEVKVKQETPAESPVEDKAE